MKLALILGTVRVGNKSQHVATFVQKIIAKNFPEIGLTLVDPRTLNFTLHDEGEQAARPELRQIMQEADAYVIVSPEYNHSYPGSLKYLLDTCFAEYAHKPAGIVGVSNGPWGGVRMVEALIGVLRTMKIVPIKYDVNVTHCDETVSENGLTNPEDWERRVMGMMNELLWMAEVLKWGRENQPLKK